jgi:hypothetical protein
MERTVPSTASEEVELYLRTYYSLLRTTAEVQIRSLEEVHAGMNSLLHPAARESSPDMSAFIYSLLRLPACISDVRLIVLGQSTEVLAQGGYTDVESWEEVYAPARRRRCFYDGQDTLACFVASRSDIDDVIPLLTAYQIEWNKMHRLLRSLPEEFFTPDVRGDEAAQQFLAQQMEISPDDLDRLIAVWGPEFQVNLRRIASKQLHFAVRLLSGSLSAYRRATQVWWDNIESACPEIRRRPVYFVSGNTHSLVNLLTGFALQQEAELLRFLEQPEHGELRLEWQAIQEREVPTGRENFLYFLLREYLRSPGGQALREKRKKYEQELGILRIPSQHSFDIEAQVIDLSRLRVETIDPRLRHGLPDGLGERLAGSEAFLLNIDYPLGLAAYNLLIKVAESVGSIPAVYVMGKAATLNGVIGDVMIPNVVHDEQSRNTYLFENCFTAADVAPDLVYGTVLDNQKAVTVRGTFLQNANYMDVFYREGYTVIEMETGGYLSAVYEMARPQRHPVNEIINLYGVPFELGIINYASDTPLSKGRNLGAGSLSYFGMDSTYAASLAILRKIFLQEINRAEKTHL